MATYLDGIVAWHRERALATTRDERGMADLARAAKATIGSDRPRPFRLQLSQPGMTLIAEIKRHSPRRGPLAPGLDAAELAKTYEEAGAGCLSVLTDSQHFGGGESDLREARTACLLPVLRKDFTVCEADIYDSRLMGADAVLLIAAVLSKEDLRVCLAAAQSVGLDALVEVHDEGEAERALETGAAMIGVNQRDLHTFEVDSERAVRLAALLPRGVTKVAESGITTPEDVWRLADAGYDAVLVGESLVTAADPAAQVAWLLSRSALEGSS